MCNPTHRFKDEEGSVRIRRRARRAITRMSYQPVTILSCQKKGLTVKEWRVGVFKKTGLYRVKA